VISKLLGLRIFDIEASSRCNVRCKFCPRDVLPDTGLMSRETFLHLLHGVAPGTTDTFSFVGIGEPLLNPRLGSFLLQTKTWFPKARTWVTSNATLLSEEKLAELLDARLDTLDISFNGTDAATYDGLVRGARFERTMANIERAVRVIRDTHGPTRLQINFILTAENLAREEEIKGFWRARGIERFRVQHLHNRAGAIRPEGMTQPDRAGLRGGCQVFGNFHFISWRGDALYCCHDVRRNVRVGNVNGEPWKAIAERKREISRQGAWPEFCAQCTDPQRNHLLDYLDGQVWREAGQMVCDGLAALVGRKQQRTVPVEPEPQPDIAVCATQPGEFNLEAKGASRGRSPLNRVARFAPGTGRTSE
jgi:sulfatase maturation enzyme AslB (radical SAM superfamily)